MRHPEHHANFTRDELTAIKHAAHHKVQTDMQKYPSAYHIVLTLAHDKNLFLPIADYINAYVDYHVGKKTEQHQEALEAARGKLVDVLQELKKAHKSIHPDHFIGRVDKLSEQAIQEATTLKDVATGGSLGSAAEKVTARRTPTSGQSVLG